MYDKGPLEADKIEDILAKVKSGEVEQFAYAYVKDGQPCFSTALADIGKTDSKILVRALFSAMESLCMRIATYGETQHEFLRKRP